MTMKRYVWLVILLGVFFLPVVARAQAPSPTPAPSPVRSLSENIAAVYGRKLRRLGVLSPRSSAGELRARVL